MRRKKNYYSIIRIQLSPNRGAGCTQISNSARKGEREVAKNSCLSKLSKQIPQSLNMLTFAPTKQKVMQSKYCAVATKEFKVNSFGNATIEESSPPLNREILKMYSSTVGFCQKEKGSQRKTATDFKNFFRQNLLQGSSTCNVPDIIFTHASTPTHIAQLDCPNFNCCCFKKIKGVLNVSAHTHCHVPEISLWGFWHWNLCMAGWVQRGSSHLNCYSGHK